MISQAKRRQALALLDRVDGLALNQLAQITVTEFGPDGAIAIEIAYANQTDEDAFWTGLAEFLEPIEAMAG